MASTEETQPIEVKVDIDGTAISCSIMERTVSAAYEAADNVLDLLSQSGTARVVQVDNGVAVEMNLECGLFYVEIESGSTVRSIERRIESEIRGEE
jgi:hypothetical protein